MSIGFGSHLPVVKKVFDISEGPVLELGGGIFSTPHLHWACFDTKRKLVTYDNELQYFAQIKAYENDYHKVHLVDDWDKIDFKGHWGMALVDNHPNLKRKDQIRKLANNCDYIVVHDTERRWKHKYKYHEIYPLFKYRYDYTKYPVHTSVLSNLKDLSSL